MLANRGTDPSEWPDLETNLLQGTGIRADQYDRACRDARIVHNGLRDYEKLTFTGHSLGGGFATAQALHVLNDTHAYTLNTAGLHGSYIPRGVSDDYIDNHIHNMHVEGEFLGNLQDRPQDQ